MAGSLREGPGQFNVNPSVPSAESVRAALDQIRPGLAADGGNVELASVEEDGTVVVTLQGACSGCPSAEMTMGFIVEPHLRRVVPGIVAVVAI
jgi:Fe-S cluster biogenesis protein NfuA